MQIGELILDGRVILAPLAGIGNLPFRLLCRRYGAALVSSEMISCHGLMRNQPNTLELLATHPDEHPVAFQLFGADPAVMAEAGLKIIEAGADLVDINFGCPVPKVVRHGGGAAMLKDPRRLQAIVAACVKRSPRPVTVKIRAGWEQEQVNAVEIAQRVEDAGAAAITVHARTRCQKFEGRADWNIISEVVRRVSIPVIGNGDVRTGEDAARMLKETGCAGVMVGRGAMGRPWIFREINEFLKLGRKSPEPDWEEKIRIIREHYAGLQALKGEKRARLEMRKHTAWYLHGLPGAVEIRRRVNVCEDHASFLAILAQLESQMLGSLSN
ncbi:tRNA dihydrouridine synthase DusB [bacterium]|nr:tRNA dihydrouridine synthase DusB [bacterium]